ncbi:MAG: S-layer homology domain-containing protein [Peptococcaceae bacterium]|nr:S-layer homology domain-containing protein [Peptococcaceae bacterium]
MRFLQHKSSIAKRGLSVLCILALCLGLMPTAAFAATDTRKAIQLVDSGTAANIGGGQADNIYFGTYQQSNAGSTVPDGTEDVDWIKSDTATYKEQGPYYYIEPVKWRVLSNANGQLFLLSDQNLDVFQYHTDDESVTWEKSTMRFWLNGYGASENTGGDSGTDYTNDNFINTAFSSGEQGAIAQTYVYNATQSDGSSNPNPSYGTSGGENTTDKIFLLSIEEANNSSYFPNGNDSRISTNTAYVAGGGKIGGNVYGVGEDDYWWLRSPGTSDNFAASVPNRGSVSSYGAYVDDARHAVRPAFHLDLKSVLFTSAAVGGKAASGMDSGLTKVSDYTGNEWKLTLLDNSRNFAVTETDINGDPGDTITLHYSRATIGTNEYISVILADENGAQYYGRVAQPTATDGTVEITIPSGLADGTYTLNVFSEQYNGDYKTDYASAFEAVSLTVEDTTAPTLTAGTATRDSETAATVQFTSDEAGTYYYEVVESGDTAPTIDTTVEGTSCDTTEQTISLTSLSGTGAKDLYIVAKDAVGNVSQPLKIEIPAIYTLTVNLNGGSGSTTSGEYTAGEVVTINAGSKAGYRFAGWTASSGGTFADASSASTTFTMPASDVTVTAQFEKAVTGVSLDKTTLYLYTGESATLTAAVAPSDAANQNVIWQSNNANVATVEGGVVTAVGAGDATITVTTEDGSKTDTCTVTVTDKTYTISADTTALNFGSAYTGYAQPAAQTVTLTNTGNQPVTLNQPVSTDNFEVGALSTTTLATGETATFTVQPKAGLSAGTYSENIKVTGTGDATVTIPASFTVKSRPSYNPPTVSEETTDAIKAADPGETVTVDLSSGSTELDKEVFETLAGKDVTLVVDLGDGVSWMVKGSDIPEDADFTDIDMGVTMNSDGIPVDVVNAITGEHGSVQLELAHDGAFGFTMTLAAPLGEENAGYWANLYYFNESTNKMTFETAAKINSDGTASLSFSHASQYAIVIDDHNHGVVTLPFIDVHPGDWFYDPVCYVYSQGLMTGTSATTFEPNTGLSRAMLVAVLHRLEGSPQASAGDFTDVADGDWYAQAVNWAASVGVVNGFDDGTFQPNTAITREQLAAILCNYAQYKGFDTSASGDLSTYSDAASVSDWAKDSVEWAVGSGLIGGYEDSTLRPQGTTTRAEVASVLQRALGNVAGNQ